MSSLVLSHGDLFITETGMAKIVSSRAVIAGSLLAPLSSVLIGLGSDVTVKGSLRSAGITALEAGKLAAENKDVENPKLHEIDLLTGRRVKGWSAGNVNKENGSENEESEGSSNSTSNVVSPRPALYVESSRLEIDGLLECLNSWVEITRNSHVVVGSGLMSHNLNATLIRVRLKSSLIAKEGSIVSGASLLVSEYSTVHAVNGSVASYGLIELKDRATLTAKSLSSKSDLWIESRSQMRIDESVEVGGALVSVSKSSELQCGGRGSFNIW